MRQGIVSKLMKFSAFVDLNRVEGFINLNDLVWLGFNDLAWPGFNDLAWPWFNDPSEIGSEGDQVTAHIANIDKKHNKISLVLRKVEGDSWQGAADYFLKVEDHVQAAVMSIDEKNKFGDKTYKPGILPRPRKPFLTMAISSRLRLFSP